MNIKEADIASAAMDWLSGMGWDCYPEVNVTWGPPRADIVATQGNLVWVLEAKMSLSLSLLDQAMYWIGRAHFVSVVTPARSKPSRVTALDVMTRHGIGAIAVAQGHVKEVRQAKLRRSAHSAASKLRAALHPDMKRFTPGATAAEGYSTPWRRTMDSAVRAIKRAPGIGTSELVATVDHHYASPTGAKSCLSRWLQSDDRVVVRRERGRFAYYPKPPTRSPSHVHQSRPDE